MIATQILLVYDGSSESDLSNKSAIFSIQNLALFGALLFFLGMKNSIPRRHSKRRAAKAKTTWLQPVVCSWDWSYWLVVSSSCLHTYTFGMPVGSMKWGVVEFDSRNLSLLGSIDLFCYGNCLPPPRSKDTFHGCWYIFGCSIDPWKAHVSVHNLLSLYISMENCDCQGIILWVATCRFARAYIAIYVLFVFSGLLFWRYQDVISFDFAGWWWVRLSLYYVKGSIEQGRSQEFIIKGAK